MPTQPELGLYFCLCAPCLPLVLPPPTVLPCPPANLGQHQPRHLGFVKSFTDELKLIFHLVLEVIRFKLVTFSGHKTPGMFYSLSVFISETHTCNPFQGQETSMKVPPTQRRLLCLPSTRSPSSSTCHSSYLVAHLSTRVDVPEGVLAVGIRGQMETAMEIILY